MSKVTEEGIHVAFCTKELQLVRISTDRVEKRSSSSVVASAPQTRILERLGIQPAAEQRREAKADAYTAPFDCATGRKRWKFTIHTAFFFISCIYTTYDGSKVAFIKLSEDQVLAPSRTRLCLLFDPPCMRFQYDNFMF